MKHGKNHKKCLKILKERKKVKVFENKQKIDGYNLRIWFWLHPAAYQ